MLKYSEFLFFLCWFDKYKHLIWITTPPYYIMMWNCISFQPCAHVCHCIKDVRGLLLLYFSFFHTPSLTQTFLSWICLTVNRFQFLIFQNEIYIPGANRGSRTSWSGQACTQSWQWLFSPATCPISWVLCKTFITEIIEVTVTIHQEFPFPFQVHSVHYPKSLYIHIYILLYIYKWL